MRTRFGVGDYQYEHVEDWGEWPVDGVASDVATDSQDRVYIAVRTSQTAESKTGVMLVFDRAGRFLRSWARSCSPSATACGSARKTRCSTPIRATTP